MFFECLGYNPLEDKLYMIGSNTFDSAKWKGEGGYSYGHITDIYQIQPSVQLAVYSNLYQIPPNYSCSGDFMIFGKDSSILYSSSRILQFSTIDSGISSNIYRANPNGGIANYLKVSDSWKFFDKSVKAVISNGELYIFSISTYSVWQNKLYHCVLVLFLFPMGIIDMVVELPDNGTIDIVHNCYKIWTTDYFLEVFYEVAKKDNR